MNYPDFSAEFDGDKGLLVVRDGEHEVGKSTIGSCRKSAYWSVLSTHYSVELLSIKCLKNLLAFCCYPIAGFYLCITDLQACPRWNQVSLVHCRPVLHGSPFQ